MTEDEPLSERPLHVRVAQTLGWTDPHRAGYVRFEDDQIKDDKRQWFGFSPWQARRDTRFDSQEIPRYDTSWAETGPLIEKYGIGLSLGYKLSDPPQPGQTWVATPWDYTLKGFPGEHVFADGDSPLRAVCALLLMLAEAGKLEER